MEWERYGHGGKENDKVSLAPVLVFISPVK